MDVLAKIAQNSAEHGFTNPMLKWAKMGQHDQNGPECAGNMGNYRKKSGERAEDKPDSQPRDMEYLCDGI